jgi:hypothetical protein
MGFKLNSSKVHNALFKVKIKIKSGEKVHLHGHVKK